MDSLFFWTSKLAWRAFAPDTLLLLLVLVTWLSLWRGATGTAKAIIGLLAIGLTGLALFPVGEWLLYPLEVKFSPPSKLPETVDGIIVLSGPEDAIRADTWNQAELLDGAERDLAFLKLAKLYPNAKLVFTGGSGSILHQQYRGADVARLLFQEQGLDTSRVLFERNSRNTFENAVLSKAEVDPEPDETWILITSAYHMPRSIGIFCKLGWPAIPYPVDHRTTPGDLIRVELDLSGHLAEFKTAMREWMALLGHYVTGKTTSLVPDRCR